MKQKLDVTTVVGLVFSLIFIVPVLALITYEIITR